MDFMNKLLAFTFLLASILYGCSQPGYNKGLINPQGTTISTRILTPNGFKRQTYKENTFEYYLSHLKLKPHGSKVKIYDGSEKRSNGVYIAVVDMDIGNRNLQQCADAVMRLKGEYLFKTGQEDKIHFNFTNGFRVDYSKWKEGYRVAVKGNDSHWAKTASPSNTYADFRKYMNIVFAYAGTLSLSKELKRVPLSDIRIGDVFIHGGSPGHSAIVVDIAEDPNNNKIFLLAQGYMPAQETQILINPNDKNLSPWYSVNDIEDRLITPEYVFRKAELKRFVD